MPTFRYRAYGIRGDLAEGSIEAASADAANEALWTQGLTPFAMRSEDQSNKPWWRRDITFGGGSLRAELASFTREFATLNSAEIPLDDALRIACDQAGSVKMRDIVGKLLVDVLNGANLSAAMEKYPEMFPSDYVSMVRAGEIGGTLTQIFEELAEVLDRRIEVRAKVESALVYPAVLIVLAIASLGIVAGSLVPSIAPIFAQSGKPMPAGLRFLVAVQSRWAEIVAVTGIIGALAFGGAFAALRRPAIRLGLDQAKLKIPVFGTLLLQQDTARLARTLGTLLKSGVPLVAAATSARSVISNSHLAAGIDGAIESIREGAALHRALGANTGLPELALRMIAIGEEAGRLDRMLMRVAVTLERQTARRIERLMTVLTPSLTLAIAVLVGGLLMTVMNAILSINDLTQQ
ncbi:MAG TPA: type II secretion system F family protein [Xanthobacteraceae bacterium]|jgi:general secretion pathway protein F